MVGEIRYYSSIDTAVLEILTLEYNAVAGHQLAHIGQLDLRAKDRLGARIHDYLAAYDRDGAAPADDIIVGIAAVGINAIARPLRYIAHRHSVQPCRHISTKNRRFFIILSEHSEKAELTHMTLQYPRSLYHIVQRNASGSFFLKKADKSEK